MRLRRSAGVAAAALGLGVAPACIDDGGAKTDASDAVAETTDATGDFIAPQPPPRDTLDGPDTDMPDVIPPQPPPDTTQGFDAIPPQPPPRDE